MVTENKQFAFMFEPKRLIECLGTMIIGFAGKYGRQTHFPGNTYTTLY